MTQTKTNSTVKQTTKTKSAVEKENAELREQIAQLTEMINAIKAKDCPQEENNNESDYNTSDLSSADIPEGKSILVMSLSDGEVYLHNGEGRTFHFDRFGAKRQIVYRDLLGILSTDRPFIEEGVVYICDKDVVSANYLEDAYSKFISVDKIENILSFSVDEISTMVSNTTKPIQETIISKMVEKLNKNEYVDYNKIAAIGNAVTPKCDIQSLAFTMKNK